MHITMESKNVRRGCGSKPVFAALMMIAIALTIMYTMDTKKEMRVFNFQFHKQYKLQPKPQSENWIVVTTVSLPTLDIEKLASIDGWKLLVIGDSKTPANWSFPGCIYIGVEEQGKLGYSIVKHLPLGSYTRKNIGYLYAIQHGAKFIYDTDDDNHPTDNLTHFKKSSYTTGIIYNSNNSLVMNPYAHFGQPSIWPRGYPLDLVAESSNNTYVSCQFKTPPVQQGLVNGDPDVDAIFRLTRKKVGVELNLTFDAHAPPVVLPTGIFAPYNSQNTFHSYRGLWALLLPTTVAFRVTDIWRGYWAQRLMWLIGEVMAFNAPNAYQKRNSHNYLKDFVDEEEVYEDSGRFITYLSTWNCEPPLTFFQCVSRLSNDMAIEGFWKREDADLTDAWLADLLAVGYKQPIVVNYKSYRKPKLCTNRKHSNPVLFFPVVQNTSYLVPFSSDSHEAPQRFERISALCPSIASKLPNVSPSFTFSNILLVLVFHYPYLEVVPLLDEVFSNHFPNILYCANVNSTDWSSLHNYNINLPESDSRRLSFINSTLTAGYFAYECAVQAIQMGYEVDGYFVVDDDILFNFWLMKSMDTDQVYLEGDSYRNRSRFSNETNWIWWNSETIGRIPTNAFLDEIAKIALLNSTLHNDSVNEDRNIAIKQYFQNRFVKGFNMTTVSFCLSDIYYIPNNAASIFYHAASMLSKHTVFLEIAVPTALDGLLPIQWMNMPGDSLWGGDRNEGPMKYYNVNKTYLHPVKLGLLPKSENFTLQFCEKYVSELIKNW